MSRWFALAGICVCIGLPGRSALGQSVSGDDQVMAARAAAEYLLAQNAAELADRPVFLVALGKSNRHEGGPLVERRWDAGVWAHLEQGLRGRLAAGARPFGPDRRASQAFHELVLTPPVVTGDSAELDASICGIQKGGRACHGDLYTIRLGRAGGVWKVVSARVIGAA